jgi:hypothetical protein
MKKAEQPKDTGRVIYEVKGKPDVSELQAFFDAPSAASVKIDGKTIKSSFNPQPVPCHDPANPKLR